MPCNAVSMINAKVNVGEQVAELLSRNDVEIVVTSILDTHQIQWGISTYLSDVVFEGYNGTRIVYHKNGEVEMTTRNMFLDVEGILSEIRETLEMAAGLVLQDKIAQAFRQIGYVSSDQSIGDIRTLEVNI